MTRIYSIFLVIIVFPFFTFCAFSENKLFVNFSSGYFYPSQREFRDIYGGGNPFCVYAYLKLKNYFYISSGWEIINMEGKALGEGEEEYFLKFRKISFPISLLLRKSLERVSFSLGAGLSYNSFKERWESLPLQYSDSKTGYFGSAGIEIMIFESTFLTGLIKLEKIPSKESAFSKSIDLGGMKVLVGLSFRIL